MSWPQDRLLDAGALLFDRKTGKSAPSGFRDDEGVWWPLMDEQQPCCTQLHPHPTVQDPNALEEHCRTAEHIATMYGLTETDVTERAGQMDFLKETVNDALVAVPV